MMYDFLICFWILFARILLRIFASMFISGLQFSFFVASLLSFGIRVMVALQNEFGSLPSSAIIWKSLSKTGVSSSLNFWQNSAVKPSGPGLQAINAGEGMEKREPSYTVGGNANQYSCYGEQCGDFLKNWKQNCHITQQSHFWAYTPRKPDLKETHAPQCSSQHCL